MRAELQLHRCTYGEQATFGELTRQVYTGLMRNSTKGCQHWPHDGEGRIAIVGGTIDLDSLLVELTHSRGNL
jgi:hypothetical protein